MPEWLNAVFPLVGVLLGGLLIHWTEIGRRKQQSLEWKRVAYVALIKAAYVNFMEKSQESIGDLADITARIRLVGSPPVLVEMWRVLTLLKSNQDTSDFGAVVENFCKAAKKDLGL